MKREPPAPEDLAALEQRVGHRFGDRGLLLRALTHRSWRHEAGPQSPESYERLEFLGDALLGFLVADQLYRADGEAGEGVLSRRRATLVRASTLARAAREIGTGDALRLGRGEELSGGRQRDSLLADSFEALLGAVYLDGGIRAARAFVRRHLGPQLREARRHTEAPGDFKTLLQERIQGARRVTPTYHIVSAGGPDHAREFRAEVRVGGRRLGSGRGRSRKQAEQRAARQALEGLAAAREKL